MSVHKEKKIVLEIYDTTQLQLIRGHLFLVSLCIFPCYKNIPIKSSVRTQDKYFSGYNRFLETIIKNLFRIYSCLMKLNSSAKDSHFHIRWMTLKLPQERLEYILEMSLQKRYPIVSFILKKNSL